MKRIIVITVVAIIILFLCGCEYKTAYKKNEKEMINNEVEQVIEHTAFNTYRVKVDTMEFVVFRATESISVIRVK